MMDWRHVFLTRRHEGTKTPPRTSFASASAGMPVQVDWASMSVRLRAGLRFTEVCFAAIAIQFCLSSFAVGQDDQPEERLVIVVRGASGTDEYGELFDLWANRWAEACRDGGGKLVTIGARNPSAARDEKPGTDFEQLKSTVDNWAQSL